MSKLIIKKINISLVPTPKLGKVTIFMDSNDDKVKVKFDNGTVRILAYEDVIASLDKNFEQDFFATNIGVVTHSLNKIPNVVVMDLSNNKKVEALITYDGADILNKLTVELSDPIDFKVICN